MPLQTTCLSLHQQGRLGFLLLPLSRSASLLSPTGELEVVRRHGRRSLRCLAGNAQVVVTTAWSPFVHGHLQQLRRSASPWHCRRAHTRGARPALVSSSFSFSVRLVGGRGWRCSSWSGMSRSSPPVRGRPCPRTATAAWLLLGRAGDGEHTGEGAKGGRPGSHPHFRSDAVEVLQSRLEPLPLLFGRPAVAHGCRSCRRSGWGPEFLAAGPAAAPLRFGIGGRKGVGSKVIGWVGVAGRRRGDLVG